MRHSKALILALFGVAVCIGSADAVAPQSNARMATPQGAGPVTDRQASDLAAVVAPEKAEATKKAASPFPVRESHSGVVFDLFAGHSWYTPPPPPPVREVPKVVNRAPTAPPLPFSFIGRYEQEGEETLYYLVKGDRVYDVRLGDVIDETYSVDRISNGQLMFTYLPLNTSQGLRLGD